MTRHLLLVFALLFTPAFVSADADFTGDTDKLTGPDSAALDVTDAHTFMCWVKEPLTSTAYNFAITNRLTSTSSRTYSIAFSNTFACGTSGKLIAVASSGGVSNAGYYICSSVTVDDDEWHHIAVTFSVVSGEAIIYIDGLQDATDSSVATVDGASDGVQIGGFNANNETAGYQADNRLYDRELLPAEVLEVYGARGCDGITDGLVYRYTFSEEAEGAAISTSLDLGVNALSLTDTNSPKYSASEVLDCLR